MKKIIIGFLLTVAVGTSYAQQTPAPEKNFTLTFRLSQSKVIALYNSFQLSNQWLPQSPVPANLLSPALTINQEIQQSLALQFQAQSDTSKKVVKKDTISKKLPVDNKKKK